jgi:putative PIN family toxin of toxin-antitoxin system
LRFVLDTNVVVSALLLSGSIPRQAFDKALTQGTLLISVPILLELAEVLHRKQFNKYLLEEERMRFLVGLLKASELLETAESITECRDPKDNKFLELAFGDKADCIVSGDADLLVLSPFRDIPIVNPERIPKLENLNFAQF